jgi:hypothetical protein
MSDMSMHRHDGEGAAGARAAATTAIFLWFLVVCALAYGLVNTIKTVTDLFTG